MGGTRSSRTRATAVVTICLTLPLWLGSCGIGAGSPPDATTDAPSSGAPSSAVAEPTAGTGSQQTPSLPTPAPQPAPATTAPLGSTAPAAPLPSTSPAPPEPRPSGPSSAANSPTSPETLPPSASGTPAPSSTIPSPAPAPSIGGVTVYYVRLDDGGSNGVRFGCNDSLVAVTDSATGSGEPLQRALTRLLEGNADASGLYNALAGSKLQYLSGYFDGTTVVVKLTGSVQPGGVCDLPRVEAQLTQTAITAAGAARAEIYIDGVSLSQALRLR